MKDLPSWCPNFASMSDPLDPVLHHRVPRAVQQKISAFACYEHSPGYQNIRVKVFKLDMIADCVDLACPLDEIGSQSSPPSDIEASRTLEVALKHWLVQLRDTFSDDDSAPCLALGVTTFLHDATKHTSLLPFETFRETLNRMLSLFTDSGRQPPHFYDRLRDSAEYRHTLTILKIHHGRYLFKTASGEIGFGSRKPTPGNHVVLLPGSSCMHMLTGDCTQYAGCVSLPYMGNGNAFLDLMNERENMWEMAELR
jgi:hypothetical protein